jgi:CRP-like cAMP-binding protein
VLVLTRERFERLRDRNPALAAAFYELLLRSLADRMEMSERMNAALTR